MNPDMINMKETAEEAEFIEITPTSIKLQNSGLSGASASSSTAVYNKTAQSNKLQNAGLSGTGVPEFDNEQYDVNRSSDLIMSQKHLGDISTEAEQEPMPFDRIRGMMRHGNTKTIKSTALEAKRLAKRKAQRKARRAAR